MKSTQEILSKKVISFSCKCPRCHESHCYTFWDNETKKHKYRCAYCWKEDFLHNLNYESRKPQE